MIHEFFRFEGFDADAYAALVALLRPSRTRAARGSRREGLLVVVVDEDGAVLGATHSQRGRLVGIRSADDPEALAHVHQASRVLVLRQGALDDLTERIALRVRREHDYLEQLHTVVESMRELERAGSLRTYPGTLARLPLPPADALRRALDLFVSDGHAFVICIHDERRLVHAIAARRGGGVFDALYGSRRILELAGPLPGSFEADHARVIAAVDREIAPVQLGISVREGVAYKLFAQRTPGALSSAVAARELHASPAPSWLSLGVGVDTLASVAYGVSHALEGSALAGLFHPSQVLAHVPGLETLESWLELFAPRSRR